MEDGYQLWVPLRYQLWVTNYVMELEDVCLVLLPEKDIIRNGKINCWSLMNMPILKYFMVFGEPDNIYNVMPILPSIIDSNIPRPNFDCKCTLKMG